MLQDYELQEPLAVTFSALASAGAQLGNAVLRPGVLAAAAAWDPDAVPALCILTMASHNSLTTELDGRSAHPRYMLQPAVMECLR